MLWLWQHYQAPSATTFRAFRFIAHKSAFLLLWAQSEKQHKKNLHATTRSQSGWTEISYIYQERKNRPECITVIRDNVYRNHTQKTKKANTNLPLYIVKITPYFALEAAEGNKSKLSSFTSSSTPVFAEIPLFRFWVTYSTIKRLISSLGVRPLESQTELNELFNSLVSLISIVLSKALCLGIHKSPKWNLRLSKSVL